MHCKIDMQTSAVMPDENFPDPCKVEQGIQLGLTITPPPPRNVSGSMRDFFRVVETQRGRPTVEGGGGVSLDHPRNGWRTFQNMSLPGTILTSPLSERLLVRCTNSVWGRGGVPYPCRGHI